MSLPPLRAGIDNLDKATGGRIRGPTCQVTRFEIAVY